MKNKYPVFLISFAFFAGFTNCKSGLITTSNSCYNLIQTSQSQNKAGNYQDALNNFNTVLQKCDAYDAKEAGYAGKAAALNGLGQYNDAITSASAGLKINASSIDNLFAKATAEMGLGMQAEAKNDLNSIVSLTQKNRNLAQRAGIYAKIAEVDMKQQLYSEALQNIQTAISMDPTRLDFYMQRGDINATAGNLSEALNNYEEAIAKGKDDAAAWKSKTITLLKIYQKKYGTDNADLLSRKLSSHEKQTLCNSIQTAQEKGMKEINIDLIKLSICK